MFEMWDFSVCLYRWSMILVCNAFLSFFQIQMWHFFYVIKDTKTTYDVITLLWFGNVCGGTIFGQLLLVFDGMTL